MECKQMDYQHPERWRMTMLNGYRCSILIKQKKIYRQTILRFLILFKNKILFFSQPVSIGFNKNFYNFALCLIIDQIEYNNDEKKAA